MKTIGMSLIIASIFGFGLIGCSFGASMHAQITSLNVDCKTENVQVSNEIVKLNGTETWTAKCNGKTYDCEYLPESGSNCYEVDE